MRRALVLAVIAAVGCGEKKEAPAPEENRTPGTGHRTQDTGNGKAVGRPKALDQAEVAALVERWRAAQNGGDFAAYQALYAKRMTGVKRVGARVFRYDREGWLKDRGRMFKKPIEVAADKVAIAAAGPSALVRFEQSFKQGSFQDLGPKEMVVVREGSELRIAREEMLASTVVGQKAGAGGLADFFFVLDGEVLLETESGASEKGEPVLVAEPGSASFRARAAVDRSSLDPPIARLVASKLTLFGPGGKTCQAGLERVSLVAGLTPHFGTAAVWRGEDGSPPLSESEIASEVWSGGRTVLVATPGACKGFFARSSGAPVTAFDVAKDDKLTARVHAAFHKLPEWESTQKSFVDSGGGGAWDEGEVPAEITLYRHPTSGKTWAVVHATGGNPCSEFGAEMTAIFEQAGSGWKNRAAADLAPFSPEGAFDLDGDDEPEFLGPLRLIDDTGDGFTTVREFAYPDHDCPC